MGRGGLKRRLGVCISSRAALFSICLCLFLLCSFHTVFADLGAENLLLLVNENSPTSRYVAKLYRQYYPAIKDNQVIALSGLADCSGPVSTSANEIITRQQYNTCIAEPVRQHLLSDSNLLDQILVIVTTAGMPYRIEDTNPAFAEVIYPGGSAWWIVGDNESMIDAASVESELTCLWYADAFGIANRMVNPYQGCRSPFDLFDRNVPDMSGLRWTHAISLESGVAAPKMEGYRYYYGTKDRIFGPGHIYLTCRLDGPKAQGKSAVFAVRHMLERAKRASDLAFGVNPAQAAVALDDAPFDGATGMNNIDYGRIYNLHSSVLYWEKTDGQNAPPDAYYIRPSDDYVGTFEQMVDLLFDYEKILVSSEFQFGPEVLVCLDYSTGESFTQVLLDETSAVYPARDLNQGLIAFANFGCNGDEGKCKTYLFNNDEGGQGMCCLLNGAIFTSLESFNAITMFSDQTTTQAKVIDFIEIGGSGAIGHSFEPQADAAVDNEFVFFNFLADRDGDSIADLCFVEAAFSGIPYLSWTEVVIGDPLMRICYTDNDQSSAWKHLDGDINCDNRINYLDIYLVNSHFGGSILPGASTDSFDRYDDLGDVDKDGRINYWDTIQTKQRFGITQ